MIISCAVVNGRRKRFSPETNWPDDFALLFRRGQDIDWSRTKKFWRIAQQQSSGPAALGMVTPIVILASNLELLEKGTLA